MSTTTDYLHIGEDQILTWNLDELDKYTNEDYTSSEGVSSPEHNRLDPPLVPASNTNSPSPNSALNAANVGPVQSYVDTANVGKVAEKKVAASQPIHQYNQNAPLLNGNSFIPPTLNGNGSINGLNMNLQGALPQFDGTLNLNMSNLVPPNPLLANQASHVDPLVLQQYLLLQQIQYQMQLQLQMQLQASTQPPLQTSSNNLNNLHNSNQKNGSLNQCSNVIPPQNQKTPHQNKFTNVTPNFVNSQTNLTSKFDAQLPLKAPLAQPQAQQPTTNGQNKSQKVKEEIPSPPSEDNSETLSDDSQDSNGTPLDIEMNEAKTKNVSEFSPESTPLYSNFKISAVSTKTETFKERVQLGEKGRHNQSEKKRRDNINDYITTLRTLVPTLHAVHKPSKGAILSKTIDYLTRLQPRVADLSKQIADCNERITTQQRYTERLIKLLSENNIAVPPAPESLSQPSVVQSRSNSYQNSSTGYYMQDAGRTAVLLTVLVFFWYTPWYFPTMGTETETEWKQRGLQSLPLIIYRMDGWPTFVFWLFLRWFVMTMLLVITLASDTLYCSPEVKKYLPSIGKLNKMTVEAMKSGNFEKSSQLSYESLTLLNRPIPQYGFDLFFGIVFQAARQLAHRAYVGLIIDRFLARARGQMEYATVLKETYFNLSQQVHYLPNYNKWQHLYILLCCVNLVELNEKDTGDQLVQAYGALAYHVIIHTKFFEIFANIYMHLAFTIVKRMGLEKSHLGQFYIIVAYRHLLNGNFAQVFENLNKGIEMHKGLGLRHHYRECMMMKGWIYYFIGKPRESSNTFDLLYDSASSDHDNDSLIWAMLGKIAVNSTIGEYERSIDWMENIKGIENQGQKLNPHQECFLLGFKSLVYLRQGLEDQAIAAADESIEKLRKTMASGMPHNALPLYKILEVHTTLLEKHKRLNTEQSKPIVDKMIQCCEEDLYMMRQSIVLFNLMRPIYYLYYGRFLDLTTGQTDKALSLFKRSYDLSLEFNLKYAQAMSLFEQARLMPVESTERMHKLDESLKLFSSMETLQEEQLTKAEIKKSKDDQYVERSYFTKYKDLEDDLYSL